MTDLVDIAIDNGLFNEHKRKHEKLLLNQVPDNTFGVFVTVVRNHTLTDWPDDIHGCIGYWDKDFKEVSKKEIIDHIKDVSYKATYVDDRKSYFKDLLSIDPKSEYEITFMQLPLMKVNNETGVIDEINKEFRNEEFGLIVQNSSGYRATYLPKVFLDTPWKKISRSLISKAGISSSDVEFYAYNATVIGKTILGHFVEPVITFMNQYYIKEIPYEYSDGQVSFDNTSYVRNIATMKDLLVLETDGYNIDGFKKTIERNVVEYATKFVGMIKSKTVSQEIRQSMPFLIVCLIMLNQKKDIDTIQTFLLKELDDIRSNSRQFEYGELLTGLGYLYSANKDDHLRSILLTEQKDIYQEISNQKLDDIFQLNWYAQSLVPIGRYMNYNKITEHSELLSKHILSISRTFNESAETNFLAVSFEALSGLVQFCQDRNIFDKIQNEIERLLNLLHNRINDVGLLEFKRGDCRIDITGHMLSGLHHLVTNKSFQQQKGGSVSMVSNFLNLYLNNKEKYVKIIYN